MQTDIIDIVIIAVYLIAITAFGIWVGYSKNTSTQQYFLANKSLKWFTVGAAVFTSNISTIHLVGLAAGGAKEGMVIGNFEWMACFTLILLALLFTPFYVKSKVSTLPEFMERRYGPSARTFLAVIGLFGALFVHIGISLFAAAKVFESFLGIPMIWTIITLSIFTFIYTSLGGLKAVVMTENVQVVLLLGGALLLTFLGIKALPSVGVTSFTEFKEAAFPGQLEMLQPITNKDGNLNGFSWLSILLGYPILGIWYWCADQTHVQRVLAAKTLKDGQNGALFAGFLKITPVFLMVLPGIIGYILWQKGAFTLNNVAGTTTPDYNTMLPQLVNYLVPTGLRGLLAASMAAALMSCMAAALNSCATLVSFDIVKRIKPATSDKSLISIGRITTAVIMVLAILWSTQGDQFGTIFEAINKIPMTFAPAVTTVFVLGVLWKRGTKTGAMATLYLGSLIGVIYFVIDMPSLGKFFLTQVPHTGYAGLISDTQQGLGIPFMLVGPLLTLLCIIIYVVVSLRTTPLSAQELETVCWNHPLSFLSGKIQGYSDPRLVTLYLIISILLLYTIIHFLAS
jgi:solute:Na+ symporter, SSS family